MEHTSENNFKNFFKNNIDLLFIIDMEGNVIETNDTVNLVLGYSNEELIGKCLFDLHPPEFREKAAKIVEKVIVGEEESCPVPLLSKNNDYVPVEARFFQGYWNSEQVLIGVCRNMTELKLSEEKFFTFFNLSHVLMAIITIDAGVFINVNQQIINTLGYSRDELIGKSSNDIDLFFDINEREKVFKIFEKEGKLVDYEIIAKTKSGEPLDFLFSIYKIKVQSSEYLFISATNITQQKKAEKKIEYLYKQQKLLADISQLLNSATNLELILDDVLKNIGEHTKVSRVYIFENSNDESTTSNTFEWCNIGIDPQIKDLKEISFEELPSVKKILEEGYLMSNNINELPLDIFKVVNPLKILSILIFPLFVQNKFYGFIGFDECVSDKMWTQEEFDLLKTVSMIVSNAFERKMVLKKLESSELRLKLTLEGAKEGLWDWNNETGYVYFSDTWSRMLGYEPIEIIPHILSWEKLVHPEDLPMIKDTLTKHLTGQTEYYETTYRFKTKDGRWKWILDHGKVIQRNEKNEPVRTVGTHIDLTNQKEIEKQLQESIDTKNKLFSIIAHDLRGPVANFLPILEILSDENDLSESKKRFFIEEMKTASKNTFNLLENLLNWSRIQTNTIKLIPETFEINELINANIELLTSIANHKNINIESDSENKIDVFADKDTLNLVLRNLLSNAIKFTPDNGTISFSVTNVNQFVKVEISDNGVGISPDILKCLFRKTTFCSTKGTNKESGAGIGLVLCQDFVERNGGEIWAESELGKGSKFTITIPASIIL